MRLARLISVLTMLAAAFCARAQYDIDQFFIRGQMALNEGQYLQAINNFNVLVRLDPSLHQAYFLRGIAKYNLGDFGGAETDFDKSIEINPIYTQAYHYRAITRSREGKYDLALEDLDYAVELRPDYYGLYFTRGVTYFLSQQFGRAVEDFNRFIIHEPRDPGAWLNRGASYLFLGDTAKALRDYNQAIELDFREPEGYIRRSRIYYAQHRYKEALGDLDRAISIDTANTFAYFNRALIRYETKDIQGTIEDFGQVLKREPDNSLTLYNRALILSQIGDFEKALQDYDKVLNINPENVLAYYNRAVLFAETGRYRDAIEDLTKAIELYPDFANAYMNRSYVKNLLGEYKSSKEDYETAQQKVREYRAASEKNAGSFADTTRKYSSLIALDADFAKKDFNDELLQHRDIDIKLRPLYRFTLADAREDTRYALVRRYENPLIDKFIAEASVPVAITNSDTVFTGKIPDDVIEKALYGTPDEGTARNSFLKALYETVNRQYNSALLYYDEAVDADSPDNISALYRAFYYMNRGVLRAEMIDFISSIESNVQVLTMDDSGTTRARVKDQVSQISDYSTAISDMKKDAETVGDIPYIHFNLGNLYCLTSEHISSIDSYTEAIRLFPYMGDAYYNRGLVLIYLKDKEKGCIDLSRAGELGVPEAYSVIKKYCEEEE